MWLWIIVQLSLGVVVVGFSELLFVICVLVVGVTVKGRVDHSSA